MKLTTLLASAAAFAMLGAAVQAQAQSAPIPYQNVGTPNPDTYTFTATSTGNLTGYFYASDAKYDDKVGVLDNGVLTSAGFGLDNQTSQAGQVFNFGKVTAGDTLTFVLEILNQPQMGTNNEIYSDPSMNAGAYDQAGVTNDNHVYSTSFSGNSTVPAGTYVGFEDIAYTTSTVGGSDYDYNDEQFVFKNTAATISAAPEPSAWALMITGIGTAGLMLRRRNGSAMLTAAI